jgi:pimeloyl-ACP methyl ester carboxylesterase
VKKFFTVPFRVRCGLAAMALCAVSMAHASDPPPLPTLDWKDCSAGPPYAATECAVARVPLDYDKPRGDTTEIALARFRAVDQANRKGTVFVNPGGPGGSGVGLVRFGFGEQISALLNNQFDVIGFDPRGIGDSTPIQCWDSEQARDAELAGVPGFPFRREQERPYFDKYRGIGPTCFGRNQRIVNHMSTADVVRDMDLLREAVGDKQLTYLGFSYGSFIGSTYANLFPNKVRALAIDGVLDPRLWSAGWQIVADRIAPFEEWKEFIRLCDSSSATCALSGPRGSLVRYETLRQKLRANPLVFPDGEVFGYDSLIAATNGSLYVPEMWPMYAEFFAFLADAAEGRAGMMERARAVRDQIEQRLRQAWPKRATYDNGLEAYYGNLCSDIRFPNVFEAYSAIGGYAEAGSFLGPYWWWGNAACASWPVARDRYAGPWFTRTASPVLVVGNYFDGVTNYAGAVNTSRLLRGSRLLSYAGWGHTAFGRSACATSFMVAYLYDGTLPPEGTVCPANPNPFFGVNASAARSTQAAGADKLPMNGLPTLRPPR